MTIPLTKPEAADPGKTQHEMHRLLCRCLTIFQCVEFWFHSLSVLPTHVFFCALSVALTVPETFVFALMLRCRVSAMTLGGISKASKGINLSEDIFGGFNFILRGGKATQAEYIQVLPSFFFHVGVHTCT